MYSTLEEFTQGETMMGDVNSDLIQEEYLITDEGYFCLRTYESQSPGGNVSSVYDMLYNPVSGQWSFVNYARQGKVWVFDSQTSWYDSRSEASMNFLRMTGSIA